MTKFFLLLRDALKDLGLFLVGLLAVAFTLFCATGLVAILLGPQLGSAEGAALLADLDKGVGAWWGFLFGFAILVAVVYGILQTAWVVLFSALDTISANIRRLNVETKGP